MAIKAMSIAPLDTADLIEPLKAAIAKSEKTYNIDEIIKSVNEAAAKDNAQRVEMYSGNK